MPPKNLYGIHFVDKCLARVVIDTSTKITCLLFNCTKEKDDFGVVSVRVVSNHRKSVKIPAIYDDYRCRLGVSRLESS